MWSIKGIQTMSRLIKKVVLPRGNIQRVNLTAYPHPTDAGGQIRKPTTPNPAVTRPMEDEYASLKKTALTVQRLRMNVQRELELARKMRATAQRYQRETETKARSEAQQLILRSRLATQREIEELIRKAGDEIQKTLADIRMIRITAQEELAAQKKITNAAWLHSISLAIQEDSKEPEGKKKKRLVGKK